jgi:hypothetical protein
VLALKIRNDLLINLQVNDVIDNQPKYRAIGPDAGAPEHATDANWPKLGKQVGDPLAIHDRACP